MPRLLPLLALLVPALLSAQGTPDVCPEGRISSLQISNASIFDAKDPGLDRRFAWAYRLANSLHVHTRGWVLRRELLLGPGDCYDPFLAAESERLLRSYNFLAEAEVRPVPQPDSTVRVVVDTRDEWSTRFDVRLNTRKGLKLEGARLTEDNLLGTGQTVGAFYYERDVTREYGLLYYTPQLLGTRWDLRGEAGRTRPGTFVREEVAYPYVGEVSRWAGRQSFRREDRFFDYIDRDSRALAATHVLLPMRDKFFDGAVVRRLGRPGNMALLGGAITYQELSYPGVPEIARRGRYDDREPAPDSSARPVLRQAEELNNIRAFLLLGYRTSSWVRRRGLDSMRGREDVRLGAETGIAVGRSVPSLENDDDLFATLTFYTGIEAGDLLMVGHARLDGRRDLTARAADPEWQDVYLDTELLSYFKTAGLRRHTFLLRAAAFGGWSTRTPFQLTLGGERALRGYDDERYPGGRRLVFNLEDRYYIGWPLPGVMDLGATTFLDVGRIWAGDVPFGRDSGWKSSVGVGLRSSFPSGGRSTYRVDFAWPLGDRQGFRDFRIQISLSEMIGLQPRSIEDQITRSRPQGVAGELFPFR